MQVIIKWWLFAALILGANPGFLYNSICLKRSPRLLYFFLILWWIFALSTATYFAVISVDTVYSDWDAGQSLTTNLAVSGVTFVEYSLRVVLVFNGLFREKRIRDYISVISIVRNRPYQSFNTESDKNWGNKWFFRLSYFLLFILLGFNIRMEWKSNAEYLANYNSTMVSERIKSLSPYPLGQYILSCIHDISQVTVLNLTYGLAFYGLHRIYQQFGAIEQIHFLGLEMSKRKPGVKENLFFLEFERACQDLRDLQNGADKALGWILFLLIPSSVIIPVIQLYKVVAGFDTDLYYNQWEAGCDVGAHLCRIWIFTSCGYIIHKKMKSAHRELIGTTLKVTSRFWKYWNLGNSVAMQKCRVVESIIDWKWRVTACQFFVIDRHLIPPIISATFTNMIVLFEIKDIFTPNKTEKQDKLMIWPQ